MTEPVKQTRKKKALAELHVEALTRANHMGIAQSHEGKQKKFLSKSIESVKLRKIQMQVTKTRP